MQKQDIIEKVRKSRSPFPVTPGSLEGEIIEEIEKLRAEIALLKKERTKLRTSLKRSMKSMNKALDRSPS